MCVALEWLTPTALRFSSTTVAAQVSLSSLRKESSVCSKPCGSPTDVLTSEAVTQPMARQSPTSLGAATSRQLRQALYHTWVLGQAQTPLHSGALDDNLDVVCCMTCCSPAFEDSMLLCDSCNQGYHLHCLTPRLVSVPDESWYCPSCSTGKVPGAKVVFEVDSILRKRASGRCFEYLIRWKVSTAHIRAL